MRVDPSGLSYALGMTSLGFIQESGSGISNQNIQAMNILSTIENCDDLSALGVDLNGQTKKTATLYRETSYAIYKEEWKQKWNKNGVDEIGAIENELNMVANKFAEVINEVRYLRARYLGIPYTKISPLQAFKTVYGGKVTFTRKNEDCNGCWAFTYRKNHIWVYRNTTAATLVRRSRVITHELGHAFNKATGDKAKSLSPASDGIDVGYIDNFTRPTEQTSYIRIRHDDGSGGNYGYCGGSNEWQFGFDIAHQGSEEFADMFLGWVYSCWEPDPEDDNYNTYLGLVRRRYMNRKMKDFLFDPSIFVFP